MPGSATERRTHVDVHARLKNRRKTLPKTGFRKFAAGVADTQIVQRTTATATTASGQQSHVRRPYTWPQVKNRDNGADSPFTNTSSVTNGFLIAAAFTANEKSHKATHHGRYGGTEAAAPRTVHTYELSAAATTHDRRDHDVLS